LRARGFAETLSNEDQARHAGRPEPPPDFMTNRNSLVHALWALIAASTFGGGFFLASRRSPQPADAAPTAALGSPLLSAPGLSALPSAGFAKNPDAEAADRAGAIRPLDGEPLTPDQIEGLAKEALSDPNPLTRNLAFSKLLESMTPENVQLLMEALRDGRADGDQWRLFLYAWGAMDGAGAIEHASTLEGDRKTRFLAEALTGWASKDPTAAMAWLDTQEDGDAKNRYQWSLVGGLADRDIGMATDYVYRLSSEGNKEAARYLETVASEELRKNGTAGATLWAERLPDGALKGAALDRVAGAYVNENPEAAAAWAARFATADYGSRVIEEVGDEWAERDPRAAVAWLETLDEGAGRSEGLFSAFREWTQRDAMAASEYLAGLPAGPSKDSAVSGFARTLARDDPEAAVIWAKTITNEESRVQTLTRAGQAWFRRDPVSAAEWLQTANLPAEAQQAVINPPQDDRGRRR